MKKDGVVFFSDDEVESCEWELVNTDFGRLLVLDGIKYRVKSASPRGFYCWKEEED